MSNLTKINLTITALILAFTMGHADASWRNEGDDLNRKRITKPVKNKGNASIEDRYKSYQRKMKKRANDNHVPSAARKAATGLGLAKGFLLDRD